MYLIIFLAHEQILTTFMQIFAEFLTSNILIDVSYLKVIKARRRHTLSKLSRGQC